MELHRLDGTDTTGLDNLDIQDIDYEMVDEDIYTIGSLETLEGLGTLDNMEITHEITDENGTVVMYADAEENLYMLNGLEGFFKRIGRGLKKASRFVKKAVVRPVRRATKFIGRKVLKPAFKFANRFLNPVTILLRNGFLLAMKMNLFKVAERLRFGYLSDSEARKRGVNMGGFAKLKSIIRKAERIYEGAGGKSRNLKKAILNGKGNRNRVVPLNGFELGETGEEFTDDFERFVVQADANTIEEFINAEEGIVVEGLGAVVTGTAIAAASGTVASIGTLLKKVVGVFEKANKAKNEVKRFVKPASPRRKSTLTRSTNFVPNENLTSGRSQIPFSRSIPFNPRISTTTVDKVSFLKKYQTPLLIGAGIVAVGGVYYLATKNNKSSRATNSRPVNGLPKNDRKRDELGRFSATASSSKAKPKRKSIKKKVVPKKLIPKVLL